MKVRSESEVAQSCPTLLGPMDCSLPGSSVHGISQARVLEWGAITFSERGIKERTVRKIWGWGGVELSLNCTDLEMKASSSPP